MTQSEMNYRNIEYKTKVVNQQQNILRLLGPFALTEFPSENIPAWEEAMGAATHTSCMSNIHGSFYI